MKATNSHYRVEFQGVKLDPYRILAVYGISNPAHQHAVKKLLRIGRKEGQPVERDIDEVIMALNRWKEMLTEDAAPKTKPRKEA